MKKIISCLLSVLLVAILVCPVACQKNETEKPTKQKITKLFVDVDGAAIERFDSVKLSLAEGVNEVSWSSSDESVAVVENGKLIGLNIGTTVITAEKGDKKQKQTITVVDEGKAPIIDVDYLPVIRGDDYEIDAKAYFNGLELSNASFNYSVDNASVATINNNVLSGVAYGDTTVTIKLSWRGQADVVTKTVPCSVTKNVAAYTDKKEYDVYTFDELFGESFPTEVQIDTTVLYDNKIVDGLTFDWKSGDENIATIDGDGVISAKNRGETYVVGTCTYNGDKISTRSIPVKVKGPHVKTLIDLPFKMGSQSMSFSDVGFEVGKVVNLANGYDYDCTDSAADLSSLDTGEYAFDVYEKDDEYSIEVNVVIADFVVKNEKELIEATSTNGVYVALANDINVTNYSPTMRLTSGASGTFNGLGHTIRITYKEYSLYYNVNEFTFKNLAIVCTPNTTQSGALYRQQVASGNIVIDNCYLESTLKNSWSYRVGGIGDYIWGSTALTVSNSIIKVNGLEAVCTQQGSNYGTQYVQHSCGVVFSTWISKRYTFNNAYAIGQGTLAAIDGPNVYKTAIPSVINQEKGILYQTDADFKAAYDNGKISYEGYNHYWDLSGDVPTFITTKK